VKGWEDRPDAGALAYTYLGNPTPGNRDRFRRALLRECLIDSVLAGLFGPADPGSQEQSTKAVSQSELGADEAARPGDQNQRLEPSFLPPGGACYTNGDAAPETAGPAHPSGRSQEGRSGVDRGAKKRYRAAKTEGDAQEAARRQKALDFLRFFFTSEVSEVDEYEAESALDAILEILEGNGPRDIILRDGFKCWLHFRGKEYI
jgi:hypothetical protein